MRVSFISALHNALAHTREMLDSLRATIPAGLEHEVILVDDASSDGTRAWLQALEDPRIRFVLLDRNAGFAAANNQGVQTARGDAIVLLNNDLILQPGWLEPLLDGLARCAHPGLIGNVQYAVADGRLDHRGVKFDLLRRPFHDRTPPPARGYTRYRAVTAACCATTRDTFVSAGGFDETFRNGYEDIDLCLRLGGRGCRHYVANASRVRHHVSQSPGRFAHESGNLQLFLERWGWPPPGPPPRVRGANYLGRHWRHPWRFNGPKLVLALAWLVTGRPCTGLESRLGVTIKFSP